MRIHRARVSLFVPMLAALALTAVRPAHGQGADCEPEWHPTFGQPPGVDLEVNALAVFDDGSGRALYAGGFFHTAGGGPASRVARWSGTNWSPLGAGIAAVNGSFNPSVSAMAVFDDGSGPALFVGGLFNLAGGLPADNIAKWDGQNWSAVGGGLVNGEVSALAVYDDGGGPALYAGGYSWAVSGPPLTNLSKWDGSSWTLIPTAPNDELFNVRALAVFDGGRGPELFVGGNFEPSATMPSLNLASWNGTSWSGVGGGVPGGAGGGVFSLAVVDFGHGPALFVGGDFGVASAPFTGELARWDGAHWSSVGGGVNGPVTSLAGFDAGSGPTLIAGGYFDTAGGLEAHRAACWNGRSWSPLGSGLAQSFPYEPSADAMVVFDDGAGPALIVGGKFQTAGGVECNDIGRWDGAAWDQLGHGLNDDVSAFTTFDDGSGPKLVAGGDFTQAGGEQLGHVAVWDNAKWNAVGEGFEGPARSFASFDDGSGSALYAGGFLSEPGGGPIVGVKRWTGKDWVIPGDGIEGSVHALAAHDDGTGPALYAGIGLTASTGLGGQHIARWDGAEWSSVGGGMNEFVYALAEFDDGSGPALYAAGRFTLAGGVPVSRIARWDGAAWSGLGSGVNSTVYALKVYDDGGGPALFATGQFTIAGGQPALRIAKWNGTTWSALGNGLVQYGRALTVFDDGTGPELYAAGNFWGAGSVMALSVARWNGSTWSALGPGLPGNNAGALHVFDDGSGPALYVGGGFTTPDHHDAYVAKWGGCSGPWKDLGHALAGSSGLPELTGSGPLSAHSSNELSLANAAPAATASLVVGPAQLNAPFKGGTLVPFPLIVLPFPTGANGTLHLPFVWPAGQPSGLELDFQFWIQDPSAVKGLSASNGLKGTTF